MQLLPGSIYYFFLLIFLFFLFTIIYNPPKLHKAEMIKLNKHQRQSTADHPVVTKWLKIASYYIKKTHGFAPNLSTKTDCVFVFFLQESD